mgnify:CR=1 FL=1
MARPGAIRCGRASAPAVLLGAGSRGCAAPGQVTGGGAGEERRGQGREGAAEAGGREGGGCWGLTGTDVLGWVGQARWGGVSGQASRDWCVQGADGGAGRMQGRWWGRAGQAAPSGGGDQAAVQMGMAVGVAVGVGVRGGWRAGGRRVVQPVSALRTRKRWTAKQSGLACCRITCTHTACHPPPQPPSLPPTQQTRRLPVLHGPRRPDQGAQQPGGLVSGFVKVVGWLGGLVWLGLFAVVGYVVDGVLVGVGGSDCGVGGWWRKCSSALTHSATPSLYSSRHPPLSLLIPLPPLSPPLLFAVHAAEGHRPRHH